MEPKQKVRLTARALYESGYRSISNKYRLVSRIDRPDWKDVLAAGHVNGHEWVECLGDDNAADYYRGCTSKDRLTVDPDVHRRIKRLSRADYVRYEAYRGPPHYLPKFKVRTPARPRKICLTPTTP